MVMVLPLYSLSVCLRADDSDKYRSQNKRDRMHRTAVIKSKVATMELLTYCSSNFSCGNDIGKVDYWLNLEAEKFTPLLKTGLMRLQAVSTRPSWY